MTLLERYQAFIEKFHSIPKQGREIKIIAVSKTRPVEEMLELYKAGQLVFGENKVQEAKSKKSSLPENVDQIGRASCRERVYAPV